MRAATTSTVRGGGGSADHGRGYYEYDEDGETLVAKADKPDHTPSILQVVYSSISLAAGGQVVFTYNTTGGRRPSETTFKLEFQGGEGPGLDAEDPTVGFGDVSGNTATLGELVVSVGEAAAGTGELDVMHDAIQAGDTDAEITFIYTAAGQIDYPGTFAVRVPAAWVRRILLLVITPLHTRMRRGRCTSWNCPVCGGRCSGCCGSGYDRDLIAKIRGAASPLVGVGIRLYSPTQVLHLRQLELTISPCSTMMKRSVMLRSTSCLLKRQPQLNSQVPRRLTARILRLLSPSVL